MVFEMLGGILKLLFQLKLCMLQIDKGTGIQLMKGDMRCKGKVEKVMWIGELFMTKDILVRDMESLI